MRIEFNNKENEIIGYNDPIVCVEEGSPFFNRPITPKENLMRLFNREIPYWIPIVGFRGWDIQNFRPRIFPDNYACHLVYDSEPVIQYESNTQKGWFNLEWEFVPQAGGATIRPGGSKVPSMSNWEEYVSIPDIKTLDWEGCAERNKEYLNTDSMTQIGFLSSLWERLISLMDVSNAAIALIDEDEQEGIHRLFDQLCDLYDEIIDNSVKYFNIDMVLMHDDWGTQKAPFFSPAVHREMILPYMKRIVESCHSRGVKFELHCCGNNEILVPNMIEAGIDLWQGQSVNDFEMLAHKYKDESLVFGIPCPVVPDNADQETIYRIASEFIEKYKGCRVTVNCPREPIHLELGKALYELSRKEFNQLEKNRTKGAVLC